MKNKTIKASANERFIFCHQLRSRTGDVSEFGLEKLEFLAEYYNLLFEKSRKNGQVYEDYPRLSTEGVKLINFFKKFLGDEIVDLENFKEKELITLIERVKTRFSMYYWFKS